MSPPETGSSARDYWDRVEEVFAAAILAELSARTSVLEESCAGDAALRAEVEALLAAHTRAGEFISPRTRSASVAPGEDDGAIVGSRIGAYQLRERIAHGGMGDVYRAERVEGEFTQQVAIKLIWARLHGAETVRRFRSERQILASLQHPNIVTLLDGGVTPDGQPFIAMEYIEGLPLTEYCRRNAVPLEARLQLFRQLCSAVGFAHRHLVVHRDLKPDNVFVTGEAVVKVLDFGVAKLLEPQNGDAAATKSLLGPMTPNYASPEQVRGGPVTTACDVYALGVMLYELLAGARPYETVGKPVDQIVAIVTEHDPVRPSAATQTGLPYDPQRLRGDLDAIVRKAMAKRPDGRYASAEEIGEELGRVLSGQPVVAREPSLLYVARKAIARHRAAFAVAAIALVLVVVALVGALWQAQVAARERARAEQGLADVRALANSLVFEVHDAIQNLPGATAARQLIVKRALEYVDRLVASKPRDLALRRELAAAYYRLAEVQGNPVRANLGDLDGALASYGKALSLREAVAAETKNDPADVQSAAEAEFGMGTLLRARGEIGGARAAFTHVADRMEPLVGRGASTRDPRQTLVSAYQRLTEIANTAGDTDEVERIVARAVVHAEALVHDHPADTMARLGLAMIYHADAEALGRRAKYAEALTRMWESRVILEKLMAESPLDTRFTMGLLYVRFGEAQLLDVKGEPLAALAVYEHQLDVARHLVSRDPKDISVQIAAAIALRHVGDSLMRSGRTEEARRHFEEGRDIMTAVVARDPSNGFAVDGFAAILRLQGEALHLLPGAANRARACVAFKEAVRHWDALKARRAFPPESAEDYGRTRSRVAECDAGRR